ncbi:unnamed protein product [Peniophora sp. CBMAI 1063]|nr:unnamed protein product [Peniophora sp. CBMAI 1063]
MAYSPPPPSLSSRFYFEDGNVSLLVENVLYKVHHTILTRHSPWFAKRLSQPDDSLLPGWYPHQTKKGEQLWVHWNNKDIQDVHPRVQDESGAWVLEGVTSAQVDAFMSVLYPKNFVTYDIVGQDAWVGVLKLANAWESHSVRQLAISRLPNPHIDDPIALLVLARQHQVQQWTRLALIALCKKAILPDRDELRILDREDLLLLFTLRATCGDDEEQLKIELDAYFDAEAIKAELADARAFAEAARIRALEDEAAREQALAEEAAREQIVVDDEARARSLAEEEERHLRQREELEAELARLAIDEGFEPVVPMIESPLSAVLAPGERPGLDLLPPPIAMDHPLTPAPVETELFVDSPGSVSTESIAPASLLVTPQPNLAPLPSTNSSPTIVGSGSERAAPYMSPSAKGGRWLGEGNKAVWTGYDSLEKPGGLKIDTDTPGQRSTGSALTARPGGLLGSVLNFLSPGSTTAVGTGDFGFASTPIAGGWPQENPHHVGDAQGNGPALMTLPTAGTNGSIVSSPEAITPAVPEIQVEPEPPSPTSTNLDSISEAQDLDSTDAPEAPVAESAPERKTEGAKDDVPRKDTQGSESGTPTPDNASSSRASSSKPPSEPVPDVSAGGSAGGRSTPDPTSKSVPPPPKTSKKRRKTLKRRATESSATAPVLS